MQAAFGTPILQRRSRRHPPPSAPSPGQRVITISLDFIIVSPSHVNLDQQLDVANEVFAPCRVQFYVSDTYTFNTDASRRLRRVEGVFRIEDDHPSPAVRLADQFATMSGRIKIFFVEDTGGFAAFSIPFTLDHQHGNRGVRAYISDGARPETMAHELGHILLNDYDSETHHPDPANLMADGRIRTGRSLEEDQRRRIYQTAQTLAGLP